MATVLEIPFIHNHWFTWKNTGFLFNCLLIRNKLNSNLSNLRLLPYLSFGLAIYFHYISIHLVASCKVFFRYHSDRYSIWNPLSQNMILNAFSVIPKGCYRKYLCNVDCKTSTNKIEFFHFKCYIIHISHGFEGRHTRISAPRWYKSYVTRCRKQRVT